MPSRQPSILRNLLTASALVLLWAISRSQRHRRPRKGTGVYDIQPLHMGLWTLLFFAADILAIPTVLRSKELITAKELEDSLLHTFSWPDRIALRQNPEQREAIRRLSDHVLSWIILLPFALFADPRLRKDRGILIPLYAWVHAVTYTIYSFSPLGPAFNDKFRPVVYFTSLLAEARIAGNNRNAFFSGHTGNAACATFFMAKVYNDYHPGISAGEKRLLFMLATLPPLLLGWLRVKAGKHFPSDVLMAVAIGGSCGVLIPELYRD